MAEGLNGTFKAELIEHQGPWRDFDQAERALVQWVAWYNSERLHSALDYVPPDECEQTYWTMMSRGQGSLAQDSRDPGASGRRESSAPRGLSCPGRAGLLRLYKSTCRAERMPRFSFP